MKMRGFKNKAPRFCRLKFKSVDKHLFLLYYKVKIKYNVKFLKKGEFAMNRIFACIDLKSFYASVECRERGLDPLTTNLVVADASRTEKTICLAVTPSLKAYGIPGRARLFEVVQKVKEINYDRKIKSPKRKLEGESYSSIELNNNPNLALTYIAAPPRMGYYMKYSTNIYDIYLKYLAPEDIFAYSIDEVFCDLTKYLKIYKVTPRELVTKMIKNVYDETGITATAGIGTNLYLAKIAMDVGAKKIKPNEYGVRIAELDEMSYRKKLWNHRPLTDFWRIGKGYAKKLEANGMYTMGDIARCSINKEELLYKLFGINAELLIDHAWGYEPCTIENIKAYRSTNNSISSGQVIHCAYDYEKAKLIVREMTDLLVLDLVEKKLVTDQIVLTIGYDVENLIDPNISRLYEGEIVVDAYGRNIPKHAHGTKTLGEKTSSTKRIIEATMELYDEIVNRNLLVRRVTVVANNVVDESKAKTKKLCEQLDMFVDYEAKEKEEEKKEFENKKEKDLQHAVINIKNKYGKNAIIKGMNLQEGGTTIERNKQIGGHKE